MNLLFLLLKVN